MPVYKNLYTFLASQYIDGSYSSELTPSELTSLGRDLISGLEDEIARNRSSTLLIAKQLNELEAGGLRSNHKNLEKISLQYVHLFTDPVALPTACSGRRDKIKRMQEADLSIRFAALGLSLDGPDEPPRLTGGLFELPKS